MSNQHTVTINGVHYDPKSGLPVKTPQAEKTQADTAAKLVRSVGSSAGGVHRKTHRSQTLNRAFVKKPNSPRSMSEIRTGNSQAKPVAHIRSPHISKYAPKPAAAAPAIHTNHASKDITPQKHPHVAKANHAVASAHAAHAPAQPKPAQEQKQQAITKALENAKSSSASTHKQTKKRKGSRFASVASATLAVFLLAGYFTYINMPTLSVKLAASQAGIAASYPQYRPSGYSLNGPVAFIDGQVTMNFAANAGPQKFALNQTKSTWDSTALLTNYVEPQSSGEYATYNDSGLTIYTYDNKAAWMNNGILHTIDGSAPLSNDQIRSIATSM